MMSSENVMVTPLFHQRSHSMPVGHAFINNNPNDRTYDFKRSSPLKNDLTTTTASDGFPLPIPKSLASQLHNNNNTATTTTTTNESTTEDEPNFFCSPKTILNLFDYNRKIANCPIVFNCKMDRGFFTSQSHWTCYRRNYFQVTASFIIPGHSDGTCYVLQLNSDKPMQPIQQFYLRLKACTSSSSSSSSSASSSSANEETILENHNMIRPVALTQMTPKRDKGPQREPPMIPITPSDTLYGCEQVCVTFERLQFRVATANNGKRRASQQYFRLIFELIAQLDDQSQHVVSECYSSPLVVRGRSPGHYSSDPHQQQQQQQRDATSTKKRKLTPENVVNNNNKDVVRREEGSMKGNSGEQEESNSNNGNITLPPPQYVFASPPIVIEQQQSTSTPSSSSSSSYSIMPIMTPSSYTPTPNTNSAFSNFHNRSQSANDSEFFARHRQALKYQPNEIFDNTSYEVGMARALRNWQQQVVHQRADSAATYDSYDNRASTRPGTPIPYNNNNNDNVYHHQPWSSHHHQHFVDNNSNEEKLNQHHHHHHHHHDAATKLYNNNN